MLTPTCLVLALVLIVMCTIVPIMLLRERSWILFWFGPSGAPQNDTGEYSGERHELTQRGERILIKYSVKAVHT